MVTGWWLFFPPIEVLWTIVLYPPIATTPTPKHKDYSSGGQNYPSGSNREGGNCPPPLRSSPQQGFGCGVVPSQARTQHRTLHLAGGCRRQCGGKPPHPHIGGCKQAGDFALPRTLYLSGGCSFPHTPSRSGLCPLQPPKVCFKPSCGTGHGSSGTDSGCRGWGLFLLLYYHNVSYIMRCARIIHIMSK